MELKWISLEVKDMEKSLAFYQEIVGLGVSHHIKTPDMEIYFLGEKQTKVELISRQRSEEITMGTGVSLGFKVEDLDEMMSFVTKKGLKIHRGPYSPNPTTRFFFVLDPDGLAVQFIEEG